MREAGRTVHLVQVDLDEPVEDVPTSGARWLHVTAVRRGRPLAVFTLPAPLDPLPAPIMADALVRAIAPVALYHQVEEAVVRRRGASLDDVAVIVCTCDRPRDLARCLDSLQALDPPVPEVVVVDNGRGESETPTVVEQRGLRYVREPVPGLDRARNRGIASTDRSVLLFTDDDVVVDARWAACLVEPFDDPLAAATSGLVLPARLDPEERWEFERRAPFGRGLLRRTLDGSTASPYRAASMGAGASMAFRRDFLLGIGGFPEALDAGTPTQSGGDSYALARALHAGLRVVYEPSALARHLHRDNAGALEAVLKGYGTGTVSYLWQMLVDTRDPAAVLDGGRWAGQYFGRRLLRALVRPHDPRGLRLAMGEVAGAAAAATAYPRSRRRAAAHSPVLPAGVAATTTPTVPAGRVAEPTLPRLPRLSVVIPTRARRRQVLRLLAALDEQDYPSDRLQVVVCADGDVDGTVAAVRAYPMRASLDVVALASPSRDPEVGNGAATARNAGAARADGDVLVFFDDDVEPAHGGVLRAHAVVHAERAERGGRECAAVGALPPAPPSRARSTATIARNWWIDATRRLAEAERLRFTDVSSGNLSVSRSLYERLGGFTPMPRREDWEFGWRIEQAGAEIRAAPGAAVVHAVDQSPRSKLLDRFREGAGDLVLARAHPEALWALPLAERDDLRPAVRATIQALAGRPSPARVVVAGAVPVLAVFEALGLREAFSGVLGRVSRLCYWLGTASAADGRREWRAVFTAAAAAAAAAGARPAHTVELSEPSSNGHDPPPSMLVAVTDRGHVLAQVPVHYGHVPWRSDAFAARATNVVRLPVMRRATKGATA